MEGLDRRTERLDAALKAAGIPIHGVSVNHKTTPRTVRVDYRDEATARQRADGQAIADAFDWAPRRPKTQAALLTAIQALSATDRNKLLAAMAAEFLREHPDFARKLGITLDGDEPEV